MKPTQSILTAAAGLALFAGVVLSADVAQAAYPCGEGFTLQDGVCKPYAGPSGYPYQYQYRRRGKPCPEGYTLQDGFCKPYRGPWGRPGPRYW